MLRLKCSSCGHSYIVKAPVNSWVCPKCGGLPRTDYRPKWRPEGRGLIRYSRALPIKPKVTLGEGGTPLIVRRVYGVNAYLKLEYLNPSGSFKDRGTVLAMSHVVLTKPIIKGVVEDTSGNTGISIATYSAAYGIKSSIVVPKTAPEGKKRLLKALGAEVIEAPSRGDAARMAPKLASESGLHYVCHTVNPLYIDGAKTISYESFEQGFKGGHVIAPVGSGGLALGIYEGFKDLRGWGLMDELPRIHVAEDSSMMRVKAPLRIGWGSGEGGAADALMVPAPPRINEVIEMTESLGTASVAVNRVDLKEALKELYRMGLIVEPTSAAALAALKSLVNEGVIDRGEDVLIPLTGSGLKVIAAVTELLLEQSR